LIGLSTPSFTKIIIRIFNKAIFIYNGGQALVYPNNTPLLQPSSAIATAIVSLSHALQVISLKLINNNYIYWQMQMKPYLLS
jgi:hypothetical protein